MRHELWIQSFPEVIAIANKYFAARQFSDAAVEYLRAASVAPTDEAEQFMLEQAWVSRERAQGGQSELELV